MPCNKLAVQTAQLTLSPELIRLVFANAQAITALRDALVSTRGEHVSVWNHADSWEHGYAVYRAGKPNHQVVPIDRIARADAQYLDFCSETVTLRVYPTGVVEARDPWKLGYKHPKIHIFQAAFSVQITQIAMLVAQNAIADALQAYGMQIVADERTPSARILTLNF